jgi:hypothetical protein
MATRSSSRNSSNSRDRGFFTIAHNKDLPPVPNDRPSFLSTSNSGTATPSDADAILRHRPSRAMHRDQMQMIASPNSASTPKRSGESRSSSGTPETDADVRYRNAKPQTEYYQEAWRNDGQRGRAASQVESRRTNNNFGHRRNDSNKSTDDTLTAIPQRFATKMDNGDLSPPLTGKDSAYSSVSGASVASPAGGSARSPQAQFGLFPSSTRSTPKGSISGRYGAMSPALSQDPRSAQSSVPPSRPDTAVSSFSAALRRSSASSQKNDPMISIPSPNNAALHSSSSSFFQRVSGIHVWRRLVIYPLIASFYVLMIINFSVYSFVVSCPRSSHRLPGDVILVPHSLLMP